jgi:2-oxoglutarate dehydrogenase E2 component (dihydrolipoamide succinyltransferase)
MKSLPLLILAAALGVAGSLIAQDAQVVVTPPPAAPAAPAMPEAAPAPAEPAAPVAPPAETPVPAKKKSGVPGDQKGKISGIDAAAGTFTVEGKAFKMSPKGRVEVDGSMMGLGDLKEGDRVAVVYFEQTDGSNLATRVIKGNAKRLSKKAKKAEGQ